MTVVLRRLGFARGALSTCPISARVHQGDALGENILGKQKLSDIDGAKGFVQNYLDERWGSHIDIEWEDYT